MLKWNLSLLLPIVLFFVILIAGLLSRPRSPWTPRCISTVGALALMLASVSVVQGDLTAAGLSLLAAGTSFGLLAITKSLKNDAQV